MKRIMIVSFVIVMASGLQQCSYSQSTPTAKKTSMETKKENNPVYSRTDTSKVTLSEEQWKKMLPEDVYFIARQKGTERPWTSKFEKSEEVGTYYCAACGNPLFKSNAKFDSGCGWPSFLSPSAKPVSSTHRIIPMVCREQKPNAVVVKPTWGMCLKTVLLQLVCVIASMV